MAYRTARGLVLLLLLTLGLSACFQKYQRAPLAATPHITNTPTPVPPTHTPTPALPIICTVTPVSPTYYTELEPVGVGGALGGGTNESCATRESLGTISGGQSTVVYGNLSHSGNAPFGGGGNNYDFDNDDFDSYRFTAAANGTYTLTLDCFTNGADGQDFDLFAFDDTCGTQIGLSASNAPLETFTLSATQGASYSVVVIGWSGAPNSPYRVTVSGP